MRQNRSQLIHLITVILAVLYLFIPQPCHCNIDPKFLSCVPKDCGDGQNISFPFYIDHQQENYCGYPRFDLSCNDKKPNINLFQSDYTILKIHYNNQSLRVVNSELSEEPNSCFRPTRSLTLYGDRFRFSFKYSNLTFLSNCPSNISSYKAALACTDESDRVLAMFEQDPSFGAVSKFCSRVVKVPVELDGDEGSYGDGKDWEFYWEVLRRGFLLDWTAASCGECEQSGGRCGFDENNYRFQCFCPDRPQLRKCGGGGGNKRLGLKLGLGMLAAVGIAVVIPMIYCLRKKCLLDSAMIFKDTKNDKHFDAFLRNFGSDAPKRYSYCDIKKMTNSFREKLGQGGFGGVYKGKLCDGRIVAVKVLNEAKDNIEEFINEVASISRTSHVNVVNLLGFSFEKTKRALIYEFMHNGSLDRFIYDKGLSDSNPLLELKTLYDIAVGIARGLEYLHRGCNTRILHFDIKPHNILLDEDFCPKISDFGLAKLCQRKESIVSMLGTRGTVGYIAPEVFSRVFGGVSYKSDVYSYGMMILEMVVGKDNFEAKSSQTSESYFPDWIYKYLEPDTKLRLHRIMTEEEEELARKMILVGLWCIQTVPSDRPSMTRVVEMLEGSRYSLQIPPKPILCSPPRPQHHSSTMSLLSSSLN